MVDFEKHREQSLLDMYRTGGAAAGGLTVRDYFAAKAMGEIVKNLYDEGLYLSECPVAFDIAAAAAYTMADKMMRERDRKEPNTMTVEEAFGL